MHPQQIYWGGGNAIFNNWSTEITLILVCVECFKQRVRIHQNIVISRQKK